MPYTFDPIFAVDPGNPANVAANAVVTIFAPGDTSLTPLVLSTPDGLPFENPVTTSSSGHAGAFQHETLGRVAWSGGGFTGFFTAYDDIKQEAVAARDAAQLAAENAAAELSARIEAGEFQGEPGQDGSNVVPTAQAIATEVGTQGTPARGALESSFVRTLAVDAAYGVEGATGATAHIQSRIDSAATFGLEVFIPGGRYKLTAELSIPSGVTIRGAGQGVTILDMKGLGATLSNFKTAMVANGTISATTRAITADIAKGAKTATVTDASTHFTVGDRVLLSSDQAFHVSSVKRGEVKRVEAVTATTVTFEDATYDSYAAASGAKLQKMTPVQNITLENFTLEGTDVDNMERGFYCHAGENINVRGCEFKFMDWNSVNFRFVTNFKVTGNTFRNVHWISNVPNYYGLVVENGTAHGVFANNFGVKCRHLFTTGYTTTVPGVSRFIVVEGNVDTYSQSASYDTHDGSEFITITGNTSSFSEANGINAEAREMIITDNVIFNYGTTGVDVRAGADRVMLRGNRISTSIAGATSCVYVRKTYTRRPSRIIISENILDVAAHHDIYVVDADTVTISNNVMGTVSSTYVIRVHGSTKVKVLGNDSAGGTAFLFLQDCKGTIMSNNSAGANTYGLRMAETAAGLQTNTVIIGNDFTDVTNASKVFGLLGMRRAVANPGLADFDVAA